MRWLLSHHIHRPNTRARLKGEPRSAECWPSSTSSSPFVRSDSLSIPTSRQIPSSQHKMFSSTIAGSRIPVLRPRRPPSVQGLLPRPRPFTQNTKLLLLTRHNLRPQLPYLSQPHFARRPSPFDQQILRLLSTETKTYVKDQAWLAFRWTAIGWTFLVLAGISYFGIQIRLTSAKILRQPNGHSGLRIV
jgi:hypothetical protein